MDLDNYIETTIRLVLNVASLKYIKDLNWKDLPMRSTEIKADYLNKVLNLCLFCIFDSATSV